MTFIQWFQALRGRAYQRGILLEPPTEQELYLYGW